MSSNCEQIWCDACIEARHPWRSTEPQTDQQIIPSVHLHHHDKHCSLRDDNAPCHTVKSWWTGRSKTTSVVWSGLHRAKMSILLRISGMVWREIEEQPSKKCHRAWTGSSWLFQWHWQDQIQTVDPEHAYQDPGVSTGAWWTYSHYWTFCLIEFIKKFNMHNTGYNYFNTWLFYFISVKPFINYYD